MEGQFTFAESFLRALYLKVATFQYWVGRYRKASNEPDIGFVKVTPPSSGAAEIIYPNVSILMDNNNHNIFEFTARLTKIGNKAVRKVQEENRRLGIPKVYTKRGRIYYQLPDGTITVEKPKELVNN